MGFSVGLGISNIISLVLKREEETARELPLLEEHGWLWEGRGEPPLSWMSGKEKTIKEQML